jgi:transposase
VTDWKNKQKILFLKWPSNSPDLNPIENVWAILKRNIKKINITTSEEFVECITNEWNKIKQESIINIIDSMPVRIKNVIANKGDYINY